jgi:hypothetical protein
VFDVCVSADSLPAATPGWPAQRRQLRALGPLWPPARQPAWQRLLDAWEAPVREREAQAQQLMAQALATLCLQPVHLPDGSDPQARLQAAVAQQLQVLADQLRQLYGQDAVAGMAPSAGDRWPHQVVRPRPVVRNSVLGGALGGAATGLGADLAAGGLTLGAGTLIGAVAGGVAGSGLTDWLNRRQGRRTAAVQIEALDAAPLLAGEIVGVWMAQIGLRLPSGQVQARLSTPAWADALRGEPAQAQPRLKQRLTQACEALLRDADLAADAQGSADNPAHADT